MSPEPSTKSVRHQPASDALNPLTLQGEPAASCDSLSARKSFPPNSLRVERTSDGDRQLNKTFTSTREVGRSGPRASSPARGSRLFAKSRQPWGCRPPPRPIARTPTQPPPARHRPRTPRAADRRQQPTLALAPNPRAPLFRPFPHKRLTQNCPTIATSRPKQQALVNVLRARISPQRDLRQPQLAQGIISSSLAPHIVALSRARISRRRD
jgi:hypothetical protein